MNRYRYKLNIVFIAMFVLGYCCLLMASSGRTSEGYNDRIESLLRKHDLCKNGYSAEPDSADAYTIQALEEAESMYGFGSREYVEIFTDYAIPDCSDDKELLNNLFFPVVTTRFCPDSTYVATAYYELGRVLSRNEEYKKADFLFSLAKARARCVEDSVTVEIESAINWKNHTDGTMYFALQPIIEQAERSESPSREEFLFKIYHLLGKHYEPLNADDYPDSAMGFMEKASEFFDYAPVGDKMLFLFDEYRLLLKQDHRKAIACIDKMLDIFKTEEVNENLINWHALAYITRGDYCFSELLDYMGAMNYYMAANALLTSPIHNGLKVKWQLLHRMQSILSSAGMMDEACHCGETLVAISTQHSINEESMGYVLNLADTYLNAEKYDQAEQLLNYYGEAIQSYNSLANEYKFINGELAINKQDYTLATEIFQDLSQHEYKLSRKLSYLSNLLEAASHLKKYNNAAIADSINALVISETSSKLLYISPYARRNWQGLCNETLADEINAQLNGADIAKQILTLSLFKKGLIFRTSKEIDAVISSNQPAASIKAKLVALRDSINYHESIGDSEGASKFRKESEALEWSLAYEVAHTPEFYSRLNPSIERISKEMRPEDMAIDFISVGQGNNAHYSAIVFSKDLTPQYIPLSYASDFKDSTSYSNLIWPKIEPYLKGKRNIYFCADGILNNIGIEFLPSANGNPMSQMYNLHRLFHLSDLAGQMDIGEKIVAIGVSDHNSPIGQGESLQRGTMTDLPNVTFEMELIKKRISPKRITVLFNDDATEKNFKKLSGGDVSALHISTHGIYRTNEAINIAASDSTNDDYYIAQRMLMADRESLSGLILRQGNLYWNSSEIPYEEDDILTAEEIENMSFPNLQLTVLSACDTGLGEIDSEGVWGLQRAFRIAGTKSLICSLSKVDDYWTAQFMDTFYEQAAKGNSIYDSFHTAQRWLYKELPDNPEIWSSFILIE